MHAAFPALVVHHYGPFCEAVTRVKSVRAKPALAVTWESARSASEGIELLGKRPRFAIIGVSLDGTIENRDGIVVAYAARAHGIRTCLVTERALDDETQAEIFELGVHLFTAPIAGDVLVDVLVRATLRNADYGIRETPSAIAFLARLLRRVETERDITEVADKVIQVALLDALRESGDNKTVAGRLLGKDRNWVDRTLRAIDDDAHRSRLRSQTVERPSGMRLKPGIRRVSGH